MYPAHRSVYRLQDWQQLSEWEKNLLIFLRKTKKREDTLLVVCNFSNVVYDNFMIGVPYPGKYKEIFNSDAAAFGGEGVVNPRVKMSKKAECDERKNSITVKIPALGMSVFSYSRPAEKAKDNKTAKTHQKKTSVKRNLKKELEEKFETEEK